jgi:transposase-like protein
MLGRTIGAEEQGIIAMPAPYSEDFRQKAIAAVERGERKIDVSCMFNISRNTLDQWLQR